MIEVKHLTKKYGSGVAVSDLSFKVESGKIYGFLGPNGAGKSTTMNIIAGCLAPTEGQVLIGGYDICEEPDEAKRLIGYLPEQPPLYPDMTPEEYLTFVGRAKGLRGAELHEEIEYVMDATCIGGMRSRLIKNLSKGYKQRVGIAQAMLGSPEIIILDEPTVGLDPRQIIYIRSLIKKLGERHTVILSSHILSEISAVCDYVMIISHGKLVASSPIDDLGSALGEEKATEITVRGSVTQLSALLESIDAVDGYEIDPTDEDGVLNARLTTEDEGALREQLFSALAGAGMTVYRIQPVTRTLEEMFLRLTQENDAAAVDEDMPDDESLAGADDNGDSTADTYGDGDETDGETDSGTDADSGAADGDTDTDGVDGDDIATADDPDEVDGTGAADGDTDTDGVDGDDIATADDPDEVDGTDAAGNTDGDDGYKPLFG